MKFSSLRKIALTVLCLGIFSINLFSQSFQQTKDSELNLYNEANSAFYTGFYPGAVDKANILIENYPESVFIVPVMVIKGESLVYLGRYEQAAEVFTKIIPSIHLGDENYERSFFYLGKALFYSKDYENAVKAFHECCKTSISQNNYAFYNQSLLFSARSLFVLLNSNPKKIVKEAIPVLEYLYANKSVLTKDEYDEVLQMLMICYNQNADYKKSEAVFDTIRKADFSPEIFYRLELQAAFSYENEKDYETAYEFYCNIIKSGIKDLAVISLKRAYLITTIEKSGVEAADLFEITNRAFGNTSLVSEFWVRMGIDSFVDASGKEKNKDFSVAKKYFKSAKENNSEEFECVIDLYEQKIKLESLSENNFYADLAEIERKLVSIEKAVLKSEFEKIQDVYYSSLIQCYVLCDKWNNVLDAYKKCTIPDFQNLYNYCLALYNLEKYDEVEALVENQSSKEFLNLAAKNAVAKKDYKKAKALYEKLISLEKKSFDEYYLELCKVLYQLGEYEKCLANCKKIPLQEPSKYIAGLCAVKLNKWKDSITYFEDYLKSAIKEKNQFYFISLYYLGYANYVTGNFNDAYKYFAKYNSDVTPQKIERNYSTTAYEFAAKSALQLRKYSLAAAQGEKLIEELKSVEKKQSAIMFTAEIYVDGGNYNSAIKLLTPWTEDNTTFAAECILKIAQINRKSGNLQQAEVMYETLVSSYGKTSYAEESLFSCGEMYYFVENYEKAEEKFSRYIYKYVDGKYAENALFFSADCNYKMEKYERSVMLNNRLCQKYTASTYLYGAYKNLLDANSKLENYKEALEAAKYLNKNYELQAKNDGIPRRITELEKIISGFDISTARKFSEFEQRGGIKTVAGRKAGTELVRLYISDDATKSEGIILALQLLPLEQGNLAEEVSDAAKNAIVIADWYRSKNSSKEAAQYYLLAAEYYRSSKDADDLRTASALYSAVESFVAEGMMGDAKETAGVLKSLYPKTRYAEAVNRLLD